MADDDDKKDILKKKDRKKHWPLILNIQVPDREEKLKLEVQSSFKVKRIKEMIYEKI